MSKVSVFDHGWIDLVFEGRNQSYGAYQLRRQDSRTTMIALFSGIALVCTLVSVPAVINYFKPTAIIEKPVVEDLHPTVVDISKPLPTPKPQPAQPASAAPASSEPTVAHTPFVAATNPTPTDLPDTNTVLNTNPGTVTGPGNPDGNILGTGPSTAPSGPGTGPALGGTGEADVETFVDIAPLYPGGLAEFYKDVSEKFRTPEVANATTMKVHVSFVVEPDGTLSNIKAMRDPGYGMGTEAVRVLKSLKAKWKPGMKGGKAVRTAYSLPITVKVH